MVGEFKQNVRKGDFNKELCNKVEQMIGNIGVGTTGAGEGDVSSPMNENKDRPEEGGKNDKSFDTFEFLLSLKSLNLLYQ